MRITVTKPIVLDAENRPNQAGEILRDLFFDQVDGECGCYSTFNLRDGVKELSDTAVHISDDYCDEGLVWHRAELEVSGIRIEMAYFWDGDGTLKFTFPDGSSLEHWDCKNDYKWTYHETPKHD